MARPPAMKVEKAAELARTLPRLIGRQAKPVDVARLLGVSAPTAAKYLRLAATAGLLEGPPAGEPTDAAAPSAVPDVATE